MNDAYEPSSEEALATLASVSAVDESWLELVSAELEQGEAARGLLLCVGNFLKEDTLIVATDRRVMWLCPSQEDSHSIPLSGVRRVRVPRFSWGSSNITLELADGNEKSFGVWNKRKSQARALASTANALIERVEGPGG